jgi:hypothetical protein
MCLFARPLQHPERFPRVCNRFLRRWMSDGVVANMLPCPLLSAGAKVVVGMCLELLEAREAMESFESRHPAKNTDSDMEWAGCSYVCHVVPGVLRTTRSINARMTASATYNSICRLSLRSCQPPPPQPKVGGAPFLSRAIVSSSNEALHVRFHYRTIATVTNSSPERLNQPQRRSANTSTFYLWYGSVVAWPRLDVSEATPMRTSVMNSNERRVVRA